MTSDVASGHVAVGAATDVTLTFDSTDLNEGTHEAILTVISNDPTASRVELPVTLVVSAGGISAVQGLPHDAGKSVASGTFFMRLIADGETSVFQFGVDFSRPQSLFHEKFSVSHVPAQASRGPDTISWAQLDH